MTEQTDPALSPRLAEFSQKVGDLSVTGGRANPERTGMRLGLALAVVGIVVAVLGAIVRRGDIEAGDASALLTELVRAGNGTIYVVLGLSLTLLGGLIWLRNSLTRYFRYWLIRLIYEDRANTDRLIAALTQNQAQHQTQPD